MYCTELDRRQRHAFQYNYSCISILSGQGLGTIFISVLPGTCISEVILPWLWWQAGGGQVRRTVKYVGQYPYSLTSLLWLWIDQDDAALQS